MSLFKKVWGTFGVKIIVFLLVLFGGYYLFFLAPKLALPNAYLKAQELFAERKANLTQNRVALVELARLSPRSANLFGEETALLQKLQETNTKGKESMQGSQKLPYVVGTSNAFIDFLNRELPTALTPLLEKENRILDEQQVLIASLVDFSAMQICCDTMPRSLSDRSISPHKKKRRLRTLRQREKVWGTSRRRLRLLRKNLESLIPCLQKYEKPRIRSMLLRNSYDR